MLSAFTFSPNCSAPFGSPAGPGGWALRELPEGVGLVPCALQVTVEEKQDSGLLGTPGQSGRQQGGPVEPRPSLPRCSALQWPLLCGGCAFIQRPQGCWELPAAQGSQGPRREGEGVTLLL